MPVERKSCDGCGEEHYHCPECGERRVSFDYVDGHDSGKATTTPGITPARFSREAPDGAELRFNVVCWACGWTDERAISVVARTILPDDAA